MRIIGGEAGGRRIVAPRGNATRPTSDRVREALFNILGPLQNDSYILDIFAGAGTLGLEALSRGARHAVFVDHHRSAVRTLRTNLATLDFTDRASIRTADAIKAVSLLARGQMSFEWIFADPPYATTLPQEILAAVERSGLLAEDGTFVIEHDRRVKLPDTLGTLTRARQRRYGDTVLSFFGKVAEKAQAATTEAPT